MENIASVPEMMEQILQQTDCYLVSHKADKSNNYKFFIDKDGDLKLADCMQINRQLRKMVDESELFPDGNYSLEISSPGLEHPLMHMRQYVKNIGRLVEISFIDETQKPLIARLTAMNDNILSLETTNKKTKEITNYSVNLQDVSKTFVQVEF